MANTRPAPPRRRSVTSTPPRQRAVTITDVAAAAQVSKSTVSLVLQGSPLIARDTAQRVREAAVALGYVYNRQAAGLRRKASDVVGVLINDLANPFFVELLIGIHRGLDQAGLVSLMAHTDERLDTQARVINSMREHNAVGLIVCPVFGTPDSLFQSLRAAGMPVVAVVRPPTDAAVDFVGTDHEQGTFEATAHLLALGHRRIAFLGRAGAGAVYRRRRAGFARALRASGVALEPAWLIDVALNREGGREGLRRILSLRPRPTAAVCYNDVVAIGVMSELGEHGLSAGRDLAITGFDGIIASAHANPPMTTLDAHPAELGALAAETLLTRLADPAAPALRRITTPSLVIRQSSGPPASRSSWAR